MRQGGMTGSVAPCTLPAFLAKRSSYAHYFMDPPERPGALPRWVAVCGTEFSHDPDDPFLPCTPAGTTVCERCSQRAAVSMSSRIQALADGVARRLDRLESRTAVQQAPMNH